MPMSWRPQWQWLLCTALIFPFSASPQIPAAHKQGSTHGFLLVKSAEGKVIGVGDQIQVVKGNEVRSRLVLRFRDGSVDDEVSIFTQTSTFQLVSDHHIQKGPSFPEPMDLTIDIPGHKASYLDAKDKKRQRKTEQMDFPPDLANGMISLAVQNFPANTSEMTLSYVAGAPKPRVVKLIIKPEGYEDFDLDGTKRRARRFNLHVEIGGIVGVVATIAGKQPEDIRIWVLEGDAPSFLRMRGPLYQDGPMWTTELTSPTWVQDNRNPPSKSSSK